jgi:signal transduction histidine kinase
MTKSKVKRNIYIRTFSALLAAYLILMIGFSILLLYNQRTVENLNFASRASFLSTEIDQILQRNIDSNAQITDKLKLKKDLAKLLYSYQNQGIEVAVFTRDFELINDTKDYWQCLYTEKRTGNTSVMEVAFLDPTKWFTKEEIQELKEYINAKPKATKVGDLAGYHVNLECFWLEDEMIIPERIRVIPMYVDSFDENGRVKASSSMGSWQDSKVYTADNTNPSNLPQFNSGTISPGCVPDAKHEKLRSMVTDKERLERGSKQILDQPFEIINPVSYQMYTPIPFQHLIKVDDASNQSFYSEFWTVVAGEVNLLQRCAKTLLFVWVCCLVVFMAAALILSSQSYRLYLKKEALDRYRIETTNALAHDLKTPLSIISGYAQNLMENIHTEKREYYASSINTNVNRMDRILREMLELSRYETDSIQFNKGDVSLKEVCSDISRRYIQLCEEKHIAFILEGDATIKADASLMERVIDNFFVNALDYTPDRGQIRISIAEHRLEFFNSGGHIPEDMLHEIWQPYKKADMSRSNGKGSGLGLSIAGKILDLHHFSYGTKNDTDGVIFWFQW